MHSQSLRISAIAAFGTLLLAPLTTFALPTSSSLAPRGNYSPGWCTMHIIQRQRNEYGVGNDYQFDVTIFDAAGKQIGSVERKAIDSGSKALSVTSELPWTVDVIAPGDDNAPVIFRYAGQQWQMGDGTHQQRIGAFDSGKREGDMGFNC